AVWLVRGFAGFGGGETVQQFGLVSVLLMLDLRLGALEFCMGLGVAVNVSVGMVGGIVAFGLPAGMQMDFLGQD
ncbi:hypothetical protein, partial [Pseudomonas aeruginosa]